MHRCGFITWNQYNLGRDTDSGGGAENVWETRVSSARLCCEREYLHCSRYCPPKEPTLPQNTERPLLFTEHNCKMGHSTLIIQISSGEKSNTTEQLWPHQGLWTVISRPPRYLKHHASWRLTRSKPTRYNSKIHLSKPSILACFKLYTTYWRKWFQQPNRPTLLSFFPTSSQVGPRGVSSTAGTSASSFWAKTKAHLV